MARAGAGGVHRAVRGARARAPRGAAAGLRRGAHRRGARARPPRGAGRRARGAGRPPPAARAAARAADARPVPGRAPGRGAAPPTRSSAARWTTSSAWSRRRRCASSSARSSCRTPALPARAGARAGARGGRPAAGREAAPRACPAASASCGGCDARSRAPRRRAPGRRGRGRARASARPRSSTPSSPGAGRTLLVARGAVPPPPRRREPYGPVLDALGRLADGPDGEVAARRAGRARARLARPPAVDRRGRRRASAASRRERMVRELVEALRAGSPPSARRARRSRTSSGATRSTRELLDALAAPPRRRPAAARPQPTATEQRGRRAASGAMVRELCLRGPGELVTLGGLGAGGPGAARRRALPGRRAAGRARADAAGTALAAGTRCWPRHLLDHWVAAGPVVDDGRRCGSRASRRLARACRRPARAVADRLRRARRAELPSALRAAAVAGPAFAADGARRGARAARRRGRPAAAPALAAAACSSRRTTAPSGWRFLHALVQEARARPVGPTSATHAAPAHRRARWPGAGARRRPRSPRHLLAGRRGAAGGALPAPGRRRRLRPPRLRRGHRHARAALTAVAEPAGRAGPPPPRGRAALAAGPGARGHRRLVGRGGRATRSTARASCAAELGDNELLVSVLLTLATLREVRGEPAAAQATAEEAHAHRRRRRRAGGSTPRSCWPARTSTRGRSSARCSTPSAGRSCSRESGDAGHYDTFPATLGDNAGVACHDWAALATWFLGAPDTRAASAPATRSSWRASPSARTRWRRRWRSSRCVHQLRREPDDDAARRRTRRSRPPRDRGYAYRVAMGRVLRGWATVGARRRATRGSPSSSRGLAAARATGAHMEDPYFLALLADAYLEAADVDGGLRGGRGGAARRPARAHVLLRPGAAPPAGRPAPRGRRATPHDVVAELEQALAIARAPALARARAARGRRPGLAAPGGGPPADGPAGGRGGLRRFHEGFDTPDLREAAAILRAPTVPPAATP